MEILAVAALGFFAVGYFVLGGADVGVGMLLPFLGRSADERDLVVAAMTAFFLVNEVWLVATVGMLVGVFPNLTGQLLSGLSPAVIALLAGWVIRHVGFWSRGRADPGARRVWSDVAVTGGSWAIALSWGWMFANLLAGSTGRLVTGPAAVLVSVAIAALFVVHGLAFAALRMGGTLHERARSLCGNSGELGTFILTLAAMAGLCLAAGFRLPLAESVAGPATVTMFVPAVVVVTPLLVTEQVWVWRTFRHRVSNV